MFIRTENFRQYVSAFPAVTLFISLNLLFYIAVSVPFLPGGAIYQLGVGVNGYISSGEWWRILTPMFLHASISHLLFNCFSLAIFGPPIEKMLGSFSFSLFFLISGVSANLVTLLLKPPTYVHVGASGAIFGLLGFYLFMALYEKKQLPQNQITMIYTLVVIAVIMSFIQPGINIVGHFGGLIAGFLFRPVFRKLNQ
jgi:rhomboid protease GluP